MPKTSNIRFNCKTAAIESYNTQLVWVDAAEPDVDHILEDIHHDDLSEWIQENKKPEDIFTERQLEKWAEENGYIKE